MAEQLPEAIRLTVGKSLATMTDNGQEFCLVTKQRNWPIDAVIIQHSNKGKSTCFETCCNECSFPVIFNNEVLASLLYAMSKKESG